MSGSNTVKDNRRPSSPNTIYNAIQLQIENTINKRVNTSEMVKIIAVEPGGPGGAAGYVTVKPLVGQTNAKGETIEPVELYKIPYYRMQCGGAAIVMDPQPGDIGLVNFTKRDSSGVKQEQSDTVPPGSFRTFDQGDGVLVGTMLNKAPETYVEMSPDDKRVTTHAPEKAIVETKESTVNADDKAVTNTKEFEANASQTALMAAGQTATVSGGANVKLDTPLTEIAGDLVATGEKGGGSAEINSLKVKGDVVIEGDLTVNGDLIVDGDIIVQGISFLNHVHGGVQPGGANTGPPNG